MRSDVDGAFVFSENPSGFYWLKRYGPTTEFGSDIGYWLADGFSISGDRQFDLSMQKKISLVSPVSGSTVSERHPVLRWSGPVESDRFAVQVDRVSDGETVEFVNGLEHECHEVSVSLDIGETYLWYVEAYDSQGRYVGTSMRRFRFTVVAR